MTPSLFFVKENREGSSRKWRGQGVDKFFMVEMRKRLIGGFLVLGKLGKTAGPGHVAGVVTCDVHA